MILEIYLDYMNENTLEVYDTMKEIEERTDKKFTPQELNDILKCYWSEGMVNLADFLTDGQINKLLDIG